MYAKKSKIKAVRQWLQVAAARYRRPLLFAGYLITAGAALWVAYGGVFVAARGLELGVLVAILFVLNKVM